MFKYLKKQWKYLVAKLTGNFNENGPIRRCSSSRRSARRRTSTAG